jgi:hypothetical protein
MEGVDSMLSHLWEGSETTPKTILELKRGIVGLWEKPDAVHDL